MRRRRSRRRRLPELGLDDPLLLRYWHWFVTPRSAGTWDLARLQRTRHGLLLQRLPASIEIMLLAQLIALVVAVPTAIVSALRRPGSAVGRATGLTAFAGVAMPPFLVGMVLVLVVAIRSVCRHRLDPVHREPGIEPALGVPASALTLALALYAAYMRVLRADLVTQLTQEGHVTTAQARGHGPGTIISRHVLRNADVPADHGTQHQHKVPARELP
ncbi:ABC transporter permease subunit [Pseudonocardia sp. MCCB 268]|nr:ABC transporter permease subunit [Pseudonocardia cytotoxica]